MLGVAVRIAHRLGCHMESSLAKCTAFEAEMRRRLWWPLMLFDHRIMQLSGSRTFTLDPTWDCKLPLNVSDSELRPEMKVPPTARREPTDAVFAVVRSELGEFFRHSAMHLDFSNPVLKLVAKHVRPDLAADNDQFKELEKMFDERYLRFCDPENPTHFMAIWTTRGQIAKCYLMEQTLKLANSSTPRTEEQYDAATAAALHILECDTKVMSSSLTTKFAWFNQINFPFPGYHQVAQDLRRRPTSKHARKAWEVMSANWALWFNVHFNKDNAISQLIPKMILQAWEAYGAAAKQPGQTLETPGIVSTILEGLEQMAESVSNDLERTSINTNTAMNGFSMSWPMPAAFQTPSLPYGMGMQSGYEWMNPGMSPSSDSSGQGLPNIGMTQMDWAGFSGWSGNGPGYGVK